MSMKTFVPPGFVPLSDWDFPQRDKSAGHSPEWKLLSDAVKAGEIPGMQFGGSNRWYVHRESAVKLLGAQKDEPSPTRKSSATVRHAESICESLSGIDGAAERVCALLERIAMALEEMVTRADRDINDITTYHEGSST